jgi:voltage-gated potassium channel
MNSLSLEVDFQVSNGGRVRLKSYQTRTEKPLIALALVFVVVLMAQLFTSETSSVFTVLEVLNWLIWSVFACDYAICVFLAEDKRNWVFKHPLELLIVIVPFLRPLRLLRVLPLVAQIFRKSRTNLSGRALRVATFGLVLFVVPATVVLYFIESQTKGSTVTSWGDALWWAITTSTTVGYGDIYPITAAGRILSSVVMLLGITFIGIFTAAIASWFVQDSKEEKTSELALILDRLDKIESEIKKLQK